MESNDCFSLPYGYVYEIINLTNGKTYVGSRKLSLDHSWRQYMGSGKLIKQAILKYGTNNFRKRFLGYAATAESLYILETDFIKSQKAVGLAQYNIFTGGHAGGNTFSKLNAKTLIEIRKRQSEGIRQNLQTRSIWNSGKTAQTDPRLKTKSDRAKANGTYTKSQLGKVMSSHAKANMAISQTGNKNSQSNKLEENRVRISLANKRKLSKSGETHIQIHDLMLEALLNFNPESGSLRALCRDLGSSYTVFRNFTYAHGATNRGAECLLCVARLRYPELLSENELLSA